MAQAIRAILLASAMAATIRAPSSWCRVGAHTKFFSFGAVMKDHSQKDNRNPYSPLMCILLLLMFFAAIQLKVHGIW
jgi:hypothetical protein